MKILVTLQIGILRYCGATQFAQGIWAGVELEEPLGKNDGTLKGVVYFKCPRNHGNNFIFSIFYVSSTLCAYLT